jgi:hypothetical protein
MLRYPTTRDSSLIQQGLDALHFVHQSFGCGTGQSNDGAALRGQIRLTHIISITSSTSIDGRKWQLVQEFVVQVYQLVVVLGRSSILIQRRAIVITFGYCD